MPRLVTTPPSYDRLKPYGLNEARKWRAQAAHVRSLARYPGEIAERPHWQLCIREHLERARDSLLSHRDWQARGRASVLQTGSLIHARHPERLRARDVL